MNRILIVDDERNIRRTIGMILKAEGFRVLEAGSGEEGLDLLAKESPDLVLLDVRLPGMGGLETLREMRSRHPGQAVIMISGHATVRTAVEATQEGAHNFLEKPLSKESVLVAVRNALRLSSMTREVNAFKAKEAERHVMLGDSEAMKAIRLRINQVAPTNARVLILGESGTGKELVARAIHEGSGRSAGPFVKVNCAAIPEELIESELFGAEKGAYTGAVSSRNGKFVQADGGTLFLDEVGDMSKRAQAKVLRALQEGEIEKVGGQGVTRVDVRVLAATNKNLEEEVLAGRFREDLLIRLNVVPVEVPPLRERRADIPVLAAHFLERYRMENNLPPRTFSASAEKALVNLSWPGNVRELQNVVERTIILTAEAEIELDSLRMAGVLRGERSRDQAGTGGGPHMLHPNEVRQLGGLVEARRQFEAACIREALTGAGGNVSEAARSLGIDRTNLHKKIQAYGLEFQREKEG